MPKAMRRITLKVPYKLNLHGKFVISARWKLNEPKVWILWSGIIGSFISTCWRHNWPMVGYILHILQRGYIKFLRTQATLRKTWEWPVVFLLHQSIRNQSLDWSKYLNLPVYIVIKVFLCSIYFDGILYTDMFLLKNEGYSKCIGSDDIYDLFS